MTAPRNDADRLCVELFINQGAAAALLGQPAEHHIEVPDEERRHENVVGADHYADRDPGALLLQERDRIREDARRCREQRTDGYLAAVAGAQAFELLGRVPQLRQHDLGVTRENLTVWSRLEAAVAALEELHAECRLDVLQRLGHGGLSQAQTLRGL